MHRWAIGGNGNHWPIRKLTIAISALIPRLFTMNGVTAAPSACRAILSVDDPSAAWQRL